MWHDAEGFGPSKLKLPGSVGFGFGVLIEPIRLHASSRRTSEPSASGFASVNQLYQCEEGHDKAQRFASLGTVVNTQHQTLGSKRYP